MHYITAGSGPPLLLLHGTPKNSFYWYRLFPLLTPHFTLVAPDLRGFGYTDKPPTTEGYTSKEQADDVAELMTQLGHEKFYLHGEDRGADYAYAVAGLYRDRVMKLSFCEMLLSGLGLEESSYWTPENVTAQYRKEGVWCWVSCLLSLDSPPSRFSSHPRQVRECEVDLLMLMIRSTSPSSPSPTSPKCSSPAKNSSSGKCSSSKNATTPR
jgi:pimeloyl-ACP methyl ester carboxylesterase